MVVYPSPLDRLRSGAEDKSPSPHRLTGHHPYRQKQPGIHIRADLTALLLYPLLLFGSQGIPVSQMPVLLALVLAGISTVYPASTAPVNPCRLTIGPEKT